MISLFSFVFYTVLIIVSSEENVLNSTNIILVVGKTGSGKSTLIQYVAGDSSKLISNKSSNTNNLDYENQYELNLTNENSSITWSKVLQTFIPEPMIDEQQNVWYDCPSFAKIYNETVEISNTVFIKHAIETASNIKIVMVVDYDSVEKDQIHRDFDDLLNGTIRLIKNIKHFENSLSMVVTKAPSFYTRNREIIEISAENVKNTTAEFMLKYRLDLLQNGTSDEKVWLIDALLKQSEEETYPKLSVFWKPDEVGRLSEIEKFVKARGLIRKSILENTAYAQIKSEDFDFPLSDEAIQYISRMEDQAIESFNSQLKNISDQVQNGVNQTIQSLHDFEEMLKNIHIGQSKIEYYKNIDAFNLKNLTSLFGKLIKEFGLQSIKDHALTKIVREENYLNVLKSIDTNICFVYGRDDSDINYPQRIDYKLFLNIISEFLKKCETDIIYNIEVEISQLMNNISVALSNVDQQLLAALHVNKSKGMSDIHDTFNLLQVAKESIESSGNVTTLELRIKQFSTLIQNLNITSIDISALNQIEQDRLYLNKLMSLSESQTIFPDGMWIANSSSAVNFVSSKYLCYEDASEYETENEVEWGPLFEAAIHGKLCVADLLIKHGANVNVKSELNRTPLHIAAGHGKMDVAELLIKHGADVNAQQYRGLTPLHKAAIFGNKDMVDLLIKYGAYVSAEDKSKSTPLHLAAQFGKKDVVDLLIKNGANVSAEDISKSTPLHVAAIYGRKDVAELLIKKGANVNANYEQDKTPLHYAAQFDHQDVVELLIKHGANVNAGQQPGLTPLKLAEQKGNEDVINLLIKHGAHA